MICSVFIATSLDGFIARPDGKYDFLDSVALPGEDYGYAEFFKTVDTLIVGRATYDVVGAFPEWPWSGKRVVVLTSRPPATKRADEEFFSGDVRALHAKVADRKRAYVDGGKVISQFLDADLIDDLTISIVPVRIGAGLPLFSPGAERRFRLTGSQAWPKTGLVQVRYARFTAS
jgi:dihydrofolate reductase